jgi:predicted nuclease of predicted toxin-antitoxin system
VKFLVDVGVGKVVEMWLRSNGYDVLCVREVNSRAKDTEILRLAVEEHRMIITMDKDFGELVHNSGMNHAGVLILRLADATGERKAEVVKSNSFSFCRSNRR